MVNRGTSASQDGRYFAQEKKLMAKMTFPKCFEQRVDMRKVQREVINQWVTERITQLLGFEDDIVVSMAINLLEPKVDEKLDPKQLQYWTQKEKKSSAKTDKYKRPKRNDRALLMLKKDVRGVYSDVLRGAHQVGKDDREVLYTDVHGLDDLLGVHSVHVDVHSVLQDALIRCGMDDLDTNDLGHLPSSSRSRNRRSGRRNRVLKRMNRSHRVRRSLSRSSSRSCNRSQSSSRSPSPRRRRSSNRRGRQSSDSSSDSD
ncbi:hypothetical protein CCR75_000894 [Bremia lactucae]|uniref:PWI domain-containing protein n=1 Tax=Bremia lactucae TaxID=4779 RepID=A0A976IF46_BRELC|nr:hypothetical protein CCR75_000894 [Bremia lactucae]